jgi:hypothetical protein
VKTRKNSRRKPLDQAEAIEILAEVARTGSSSARIQALRMLQELRSAVEDSGEDEFVDLDNVVDVQELEQRRVQRQERRDTAEGKKAKRGRRSPTKPAPRAPRGPNARR